jgi:hypothetical protein
LKLNLYFNHIGVTGCKHLWKGLSKLINLQELSLLLWLNQIHAEGVKYIVDIIVDMKNLLYLTINIADNQI